MKRQVTKIRGKVLTQPEGTAEESTSDQIDSGMGDIIGFSISAPYTTVQLSKMLLSVEQTDFKPVVEASMNNFIPSESKPFFMFSQPLKKGRETTITINSLAGSGSVAATPVIINFLHSNNGEIEAE